MLLTPCQISFRWKIENPCVGGSIPPQATSIHAPQRPFRVLGRFSWAVSIASVTNRVKIRRWTLTFRDWLIAS